MTQMPYKQNLSLLKSIYRELRTADKISKSVGTNDAFVRHLIGLFRDNQVTEKRYCRAQDHYTYLAATYLTYLQNTRLQDELVNKYFHKGERSIESSAKLVGLELPKINTS